jgi:hypothetical protein
MTDAIMLCFSGADETRLRLASLYWEVASDGTWQYSVKQIAEHFGISQTTIPKLAAEIAIAFSVNNPCTVCGNPLVANSRTDVAKIHSGTTTICADCREDQQLAEQTRKANQQKVLRERQTAIWLNETNRDSHFDYQNMGYLDAFYAFTLLLGSEFDEETGEIRLPAPQTFSPDEDELAKIIQRLYRLGVFLFGKKTPLDAFLPSEEEGTYRYYPSKISWRFALPLFSESYEELFRDLSEIVDEREGNEGFSEAVNEVWWQIGRSEAVRYLRLQLDQYNLSIEESDKLHEAIRYALTHFSIPSLRYLIYKRAKDTAAYAAQRNVHKKQAINSIPGGFIRMCDRALADGWVINPYVLRWDDEETLLTTTLFDRVLRTGVLGFKITTGASIRELASAANQA